MRRLLLLLILILAGAVRLIWLDRFPVSLYTDEANQAYNAISILETGRDEHGMWWPVGLRSFGDWKPPVQTYLMIPFFAAGFPMEYAARLPSALLGTFTILIVYSLVLHWRYGTRTALLTAFFLAISPWHILQSRSAMLVAVALFFLATGVLWAEKGPHRPRYLIFSAGCFALAVYGYYAMRVIVPILLCWLVIKHRRMLREHRKTVAGAVAVFVCMLVPLMSAFFREPDILFGRARTVSVFYDQGTRLRQWELITQDGADAPVALSRFFHTAGNLYARNILGRFLSHFDPAYLFLVGDAAQPFQIAGMGILYLVDGVFLLLGCAAVYGGKQRQRMKTAAVWFVVSFLPASLTFLTPASNRSFSAVAPFMLLIAIGLRHAFVSIRGRGIFTGAITGIYTVSFLYFLHQFFIVMPQVYPQWWNWGWKQVIQSVDPIAQRYDNIAVFDVYGMPYIYFLLYGRVNPAIYQQEAIRTYVADRFGFEHVEGFGKYLFPSDRTWRDMKDSGLARTLYVVPAEMAISSDEPLETIRYLDGSVMVKIYAHE